MNDLLRQTQELELPAGDFAIFGSGPLLVRGIIDHVGDIDILCRGDAWLKALSIGELVYLHEYDVEIISINDGLITLGRSWGYGDFDADELIDSAEVIGDLPFVLLRYVIEYKKTANRAKDLAHLDLLKEYDRRAS